MPLPSKANSPVCWANGCGQDYNYDPAWSSSEQLTYVAAWRRPWEIPIGVLKNDASGKMGVQVQLSGVFRVPFVDIYPSILYHPESLLNQRVYYDSYSGKYIAKSAFRATQIDPQALYPGSATIGYISDVNQSEHTVGITIDPRPSTASYAVGLASTSTQWKLGQPVSISAETNAITACTSSSTQCTGVVAGWLEPFLVPPIVATPMIVVIRGAAWYHPIPEMFYTQSTRDELMTMPPTSIPVDVTGAACLKGNSNETAIIGSITLNEWYPVEESSSVFPDYVLLDVRGGTTT